MASRRSSLVSRTRITFHKIGFTVLLIKASHHRVTAPTCLLGVPLVARHTMNSEIRRPRFALKSVVPTTLSVEAVIAWNPSICRGSQLSPTSDQPIIRASTAAEKRNDSALHRRMRRRRTIDGSRTMAPRPARCTMSSPDTVRTIVRCLEDHTNAPTYHFIAAAVHALPRAALR